MNGLFAVLVAFSMLCSLNYFAGDQSTNIEETNVKEEKTEDVGSADTVAVTEEDEVMGEGIRKIKIDSLLQYPELPAGCETTSLTAVLNFYGYDVDKLTIAEKYLPKQKFYKLDGIYYGADFRKAFAGSPEKEGSYGCYAPCIVITANKYFTDIEDETVAVDLTGTELEELISLYIDNGEPIIVWITYDNLHESTLTISWTTPEGENVRWRDHEHCAVLTGYDMNKRVVYAMDPLIGHTEYDYDLFELRYIEMGKQAICIKKTEKKKDYSSLAVLTDKGRIQLKTKNMEIQEEVIGSWMCDFGQGDIMCPSFRQMQGRLSDGNITKNTSNGK